MHYTANALPEDSSRRRRNLLSGFARPAVAHAGWNLEPSQADPLEEAAFPKRFGSGQLVRMHTFLKQQVSMEE